MKALLQHILNPDIELRSRLFQLLSTIALVEFIVVTIYTITSGSDAGHISIMVVGTVLFAVTVALTFKTGKMRVGAAVSGLLYFAMYPLTFFSSGGMYGGAPAVFVFALVYIFLVTQKWERVAELALCVAGTGICYWFACFHPEMLVRHSVVDEHSESFLSVMLAVLLISTLFAFATEVYKAENRIVQKQKKEIEELNQAQKRFFSSMSHEIRTPVNAIIGMNEMTLREDISDEVRENAQNIEAASRILLHTINEIMDMSKLETGTMKILEADYHTASMLTDIVNMVLLRAKEKGLDFRIGTDEKVPSVLHGDEVRIKQILLNVITNAVKYTKEGSVALNVSGRKDEAGRFRIIFDVTDTGIGIREENIPLLFTAFSRVEEQQIRTIEGTGLGLSIVKQLLDMMDGSVKVTSVYGQGSTFYIEIPQVIVDPTPVGEIGLKRTIQDDKKEERHNTPDAGIRILAVDDTPMNLKVVRKLLRDTGSVVDTAGSGAEALEKTAETCYDLILMDHQMPEMDGIECLRRIRSQEGGKCRESRIVCLTANVGADIEEQYKKEGFDGYLVKPVRGSVLEEEVKKASVQ